MKYFFGFLSRSKIRRNRFRYFIKPAHQTIIPKNEALSPIKGFRRILWKLARLILCSLVDFYFLVLSDEGLGYLAKRRTICQENINSSLRWQ